MSETLTFGPQWLRALSSGNSVTSPPPSPGPKYKMAEYRYGKEEMLALFLEDLVKPVELDHFSSIAREKSHFPLAFVPPTEEEQRYSLGSVNSNAVLKLMGRGAPRGAGRGVRGGGLGGRGRGRGDGGFMRQSSYEDGRTETGGFRDPRRQSWEEGRRGGFERGNPSGKGYDPTMRGRLSSDTTWDKNEKGGHENWRSGTQHDTEDDGGGWRVSGHRYADKSDRWRGGPKITRSSSWRNSDSFRDERNFAEEEWQVGRGPRVRSFHERDDRWNNPSEPEWCKDDDFEDLDVTGTFDSSGAFRSQKKEDDKSNVNVKEEKNEEAKIQAKGKDELKTNEEPKCEENESSEEKPPQAKQTDKESPTTTLSPMAAKPKSTTPTQDMVQPSSPLETASQPGSPPAMNTEKTPRQMEQESKELYEKYESDKKDVEEPNMEHFAKAAENLVMSLDDEVEKSDPDSHPPGFHGHTASTPTSQHEEIKWFYTDPQGKMQGPFTNTEMADWFNHGYFTMSLMIKRSIDEVYQPLGDLIKSWGRVPFLPGPQPPPLKGIPDQLQQQHLLAQQQQQQQYQQLLQQHMMQQRFLQQQALMMRQQLHMQHQQEQAPTTTISPQSTSTHMEIPPPHILQTTLEHQQHLQQKLQQQLQQQQQQQQQQRPQALSVSSESIWAGSGTKSTSPGISPGPWSPVTTASVAASPAPPPSSPARRWDVEHANKDKIQSLQEIQRIEEEKELAIKLEKERREAALRKEEELRRRQQQEYLLQKQREQEERRRQEEMEKKKREQEELLKKQQEEARRQQEEELRKKQQQQATHQKQLEQQKRQLEEQKIIEMRKQQQQALARLQQQQLELQRRKEIEEQKQKELQQKLQQKRQQSQNTSNSLWGPTPAPAAPSLTEIQQQQEKRERTAQQEKERLMQQEREQQQRNAAAAAAGGWTERNNKGTSNVKSLLEIQQEQERQQLAKKQNQQLSRSQPSSNNPLSSTVWGNNSSALSSSWASPASSAPSTNAWGGTNKTAKQPSRYVGLSNEDDDDDDDDEEEEEEDEDEDEETFWDEAVKEAKKAGQPKQQSKLQQQQKRQQQQQGVQPKNRQPSNAAFPGLGNKTQAKRTTKDEENVRRIFQQQSCASDEFARWFEKSLKALKVTSIDIPTFFAFLQEIESPYEVHDYVKSYVGDNKEAHEFARDFIEQRKKASSSRQNIPSSLPQGSVWGNVNQKTQSSKSIVSQQAAEHAQTDTTTNKKKKKKKMQKVDPRILGFSVNAAERVNIGEIQTLEDA